MKRIFALSLFLFINIHEAFASYISFQNSVSTQIKKDILTVSVQAINQGDEPAYNVLAEIRVGDKKALTDRVNELGINQTYKAEANFRLKSGEPGEYPIFLTLHYTDANLYPFSAINCQTFLYNAKKTPLEISGAIKTASFNKKGKVELLLKNLSDIEISALVSLFVPRELVVNNRINKIALLPKSTKKIKFNVSNFSALTESNYQVFAAAVYEEDGIQRTSLIPGIIKIKDEKNIFGINYGWWLALTIVLSSVFISAQFKNLKQKNVKKSP